MTIPNSTRALAAGVLDKPSRRGFTRVELTALLAALTLVFAAACPLFATSRTDTQRAVCFNNLRQIGRAIQLWGDDHDDQPPWLTSTMQGGTRPEVVIPLTKVAVAWPEFLVMSNELGAPRILACPADPNVKRALDWGVTRTGFVNSGFRGNALSYFVSYHCIPEKQKSPMSGDRDFPSDGSAICGPASVTDALRVYPSPRVSWLGVVHPAAGHVLTTDGAVEFVPKGRLFEVLAETDDSVLHFAPAR